MNGTTFPAYPGQEQDRSNDQYGTRYGNNSQSDEGQGQNNGGWQNRQSANGGGGGGNWQGNRSQNYQGGNGGGGGGWQGNRGQGGGWQGKGGGGGGKFQRAPETDLTLYKPYTIVANNDVPPEIASKFEEIAKRLEQREYTVRIGGMEGIDDRIEKAVKKFELHLPWREFNGKQSKFYYNGERAFAVAKMFHPTFDSMKKGIQAFLAKNARLILGDKMNSPTLFLLCWTEDGAESIRERTAKTGFSGHPIAIASALGVPIFNLAKSDAEQRLNFLVESTTNGQN